MGKRKIKLLMLGLMDRIEQINAILVEKNKYKNKKRISIYNSVNLTYCATSNRLCENL